MSYASTWYSVLARCVQVDILNTQNLQISLKNKRDLLSSKDLRMSGFDTHIEVHNLGRANYMIYIYGVTNTDTSLFMSRSPEKIPITKNDKHKVSVKGSSKKKKIGNTGIEINDPILLLLNDHDYSVSKYYCDLWEEKNSFDSYNILAISSIYIDRLEIAPSKRWQSFIHNNDPSFLPKQLIRPSIGRIRKRNGPGKLIIIKYIDVYDRKLILSLYEISNGSHEGHGGVLRICLYDIKSSQSAEYRISSMERSLLFNEDLLLITQVINRLNTSYCDLSVQGRVLIPLGVGDFNDKRHAASKRGQGDSVNNDNSDLLTIHSSPNKNSYTQTSPTSDTRIINHHSNNHRTQFEIVHPKPLDFIVDGDVSMFADSISDYREGGSGSEGVYWGTGDWGWALFFNRDFVTDMIENLSISVGLSVPLRTFHVSVLDMNTSFEVYRFTSFDEVCECVLDKKRKELDSDLMSINKDIVYDLLDPYIGAIDIKLDTNGCINLIILNNNEHNNEKFSEDNDGNNNDNNGINARAITDNDDDGEKNNISAEMNKQGIILVTLKEIEVVQINTVEKKNNRKKIGMKGSEIKINVHAAYGLSKLGRCAR